MTKTLLTLFICLFYSNLFSQFKVVGQSDPFDEPTNTFSKLLQLSNGNTVFLMTTKTSINIKIYDKNRRLKADKEINQPGGDIEHIDLACEIQGDLAVFYTTSDNDQATLYRLVIDGSSGAKIRADKIVTTTFQSARRAHISWGVDQTMLHHGFYVRKDPSGSNYAVAICDAYSQVGRRMEIFYYNGAHKEIAHTLYNAPEKYQFVRYLDMVVIGSQKVAILAFASNTIRQKNRDGEVILATLDSGSTSLDLTELDLSRSIVVEGGAARYSTVTHSVVLVAACREPKDNGYTSIMAFVDPFNKTVKNIFTVFPARASAKSEELYGQKNGFTGMPQDLFLDLNGDISVVFEEMTTYSDKYGSTTMLGNIAISRFDANGKETGAFLIPKTFGVDGYFGTFYHSFQEGSAQRLYGGTQFKHYAFLNGNMGRDYFLLNDLAENDELVKKGKKPRRVTGVSAMDAFYFSLNDNNLLPDRQFIFGKPNDEKNHQLAVFSISDYNRELNRYVTLQLDHEGRNRQVRIVWLTPP